MPKGTSAPHLVGLGQFTDIRRPLHTTTERGRSVHCAGLNCALNIYSSYLGNVVYLLCVHWPPVLDGLCIKMGWWWQSYQGLYYGRRFNSLISLWSQSGFPLHTWLLLSKKEIPINANGNLICSGNSSHIGWWRLICVKAVDAAPMLWHWSGLFPLAPISILKTSKARGQSRSKSTVYLRICSCF